MASQNSIDGVLVQWGDRLFYPRNRIVKGRPLPALSPAQVSQRAAEIRKRIHATVVRRAPQVIVKVTGGGRGMRAIAAHFRYITKNGKLEWEDDRGVAVAGKETLKPMVDDWRYGGAFIRDEEDRREAFNIMLSMPRGKASAEIVQKAAREFAKAELAGHKYVMVLHDHQANPHVHLSVRAASKSGRRLNPRKADLRRWRETFAEKLRGYGVEAEATRQATRGVTRNYPALWQLKAAEDGRLREAPAGGQSAVARLASRRNAREAWDEIAQALGASGSPADRVLAESIRRFTQEAVDGETRAATRTANGWRRSGLEPTR